MKEFRLATARLHEWSGFFIGWLVYAIALSGALAVFRPEISQWTRPELTQTTIDPIQATQAGVSWLQTHAASAPAWYLTLAEKRAPFVEALYFDGTRYVERALDPVTGSPDTLRDTMGGDFFYRFHFELQLPQPFGRLISSFCGLAIVLVLISGVIIHKRIFADFFTLRFYKGQRSWLDLHNMTSVVALPFHIIIAFSGAMTLWYQILPASLHAVYPHNTMQFYTDIDPATDSLPPTHTHTTLAPITPILRDAEVRFGSDGIAQVFLYNPNDTSSIIIIKSGNRHHIGYDTHTLRYEGRTGRLLLEAKEDRPVVSAFSVLYGLHIARFSSPLTRCFYFISGLLLAAATASGLHLWVLRKKRLKDTTTTFKIVEKLNSTVLIGLPISFALFFIANRALPMHSPYYAHTPRSDIEIYSVFTSLLIFIMLFFVSKTHRAQTILSLFGAATFFLVALLGYPWHNIIMLWASFIAIFFGVTYAFIYKTIRS